MSLESAKEELLNDWSGFIGSVPFPNCAKCQAPVLSFGIDSDPYRDEYQFKVECHDDKQIYHMPTWYAHKIALILADKKSRSFKPEDLRYHLPDAFTGIHEQRVEGVLHYDFLTVLESKVRAKEQADISEEEKEAKKEFEADFEKARERGDVIQVDTNNKKI